MNCFKPSSYLSLRITQANHIIAVGKHCSLIDQLHLEFYAILMKRIYLCVQEGLSQFLLSFEGRCAFTTGGREKRLYVPVRIHNSQYYISHY